MCKLLINLCIWRRRTHIARCTVGRNEISDALDHRRFGELVLKRFGVPTKIRRDHGFRWLYAQVNAQQVSKFFFSRNTTVRQDEIADSVLLLGVVGKKRQHGIMLNEVRLDNNAVKVEDQNGFVHRGCTALMLMTNPAIWLAFV